MEGTARLGIRCDGTPRRARRSLAVLVAASLLVLTSWAPIGRGAAVASAATVPKRALVTATSLNVREGPGTTYASSGKLPEGAEVDILQRKGNWFRVSGPGNLKGWVDGNYLTARLDGVRIVVDPGHGGNDGGAYANGVVERDVNLKIALYLRDVLLARGAQVRMTRETWKENPPLSTSNPKDPSSRTGLANSWPADMLLSVHNNSSTNPNSRGLMTIWGRAPQSQALARTVYDRLLYWTKTRQGFDHRERGVYRDTEIRRHTLAIVDDSLVPATIIEVAFVSNKDDAALLKNDTFLQAVAKGIADGAGAFILNRVPEGFPDVGGVLADEVLRAWELGLVDGYPDGKFHPAETVTRAEFAKMVVRAVETARGTTLPQPESSPFKDVRPELELYAFILKALQQQYILGYEDGTFRPDQAIPREQAAAILQRVIGVEAESEPFTDVPDDSRFASAVAAVAKAGIMKGRDADTFGYGKPIRRDEAAAVVVRLHDYLKGGN